MLIGHSMASLFMFGIAIAATVGSTSEPAGKAILACALIYYFFYNGFSGALSWPIANELVSSRLRVLTIGAGTGINYVWACEYRAQAILWARDLTGHDDFYRADGLYRAVLHQQGKFELGR